MLQLVDHAIGVVPLKVQDVLDVGASEAVDALRVVPHHTDILSGGAELADDQVLGEVGVLILVDQNEAKLLLVLVQEVRKIPQKHIGLKEQVVEVHGS